MGISASTPSSVFGFVTLAFVLFAGAGPASAQPSQAQLDAIRANCRSDFMSNCWGVKRGGIEAMQCLKQHLPSLSSGCQQAVNAVTPPKPVVAAKKPESKPAPKPSATAAAKPAPAKAPAVSPPVQKSEAKPEKPAAVAAKPAEPTAESTPSVPKPATAAKAKAAAHAATSNWHASVQQSGAAPAAAQAPPVIMGFIPPRKKLMIRRGCSQDLTAYCADVSYGDGRLLSCLMANQSALTPDCRAALARLSR